ARVGAQSGSGGTGTATVSGAATNWTLSNALTVGGNATVNVTDGANISSRPVNLGDSDTAGSTINVTDGGSLTVISGGFSSFPNIYSQTGSGTINVTSGGQLSNNDALLSNTLGFTALVSGENSLWDNRNNLYLGEALVGTLDGPHFGGGTAAITVAD